MIGTIEAEAAACRAAFAARPRARYAAHVHHEAAVEALTESVEERIAYILARKPADEQALRLHCLRPITVRQWRHYDAAVRAARDPYDAAVRAARDAYDAAERPAHAAYDATIRAARDAYEAAVQPARDAYDAAERPAQAAYDAAVRPAQTAYDATVRAAHAAICPVAECPWDGKTIFPAKETP